MWGREAAVAEGWFFPTWASWEAWQWKNDRKNKREQMEEKGRVRRRISGIILRIGGRV